MEQEEHGESPLFHFPKGGTKGGRLESVCFKVAQANRLRIRATPVTITRLGVECRQGETDPITASIITSTDHVLAETVIYPNGSRAAGYHWQEIDPVVLVPGSEYLLSAQLEKWQNYCFDTNHARTHPAVDDLGTYYRVGDSVSDPFSWEHSGAPRHYVANAMAVVPSLSSNPISPRQAEIVRLASSGMTDKEIAHELSLGVETVTTHWKNLREKLGVGSRSEAVFQASKQLFQAEKLVLLSERNRILNPPANVLPEGFRIVHRIFPHPLLVLPLVHAESSGNGGRIDIPPADLLDGHEAALWIALPLRVRGVSFSVETFLNDVSCADFAILYVKDNRDRVATISLKTEQGKALEFSIECDHELRAVGFQPGLLCRCSVSNLHARS